MKYSDDVMRNVHMVLSLKDDEINKLTKEVGSLKKEIEVYKEVIQKYDDMRIRRSIADLLVGGNP
ncbi:MAG: hypothetical protein Q8911_00150 [Bacillota bacterium]|nr:hypothetical protein [Bacillota bacterium]